MISFTTIPTKRTLSEEQRQELQKWIAALRSGEYKQGKLGLYIPTEDSYCCLGVACKIKGLKIDFQPEADFGLVSFGELCALDLPPKSWMLPIFGVAAFDMVVRNQMTGHLTFPNLNDQHNFTFEEIANVIQAVYLDKVEITIEKGA